MVTIGLPVYKGEKWIREALESILRQTYSDWELIVTIDEKSPSLVPPRGDDWKNLIDDERIRVIADGEHRGISARINQQVEMARGEYFARMDVDDVMLPERLAVQVKYMEEHPEVDVCGTGAGEWTFIHPSVMGRTEWFRKHPYRSECDGCEDWDLWTRTRMSSSFGFLPEPLIVYRKPEKFDKEKYLFRRKQGRKAIRMNKDILPWWKYYFLLGDSYMKSFIRSAGY